VQKNRGNPSVFFGLLGSVRIKAARKMLMESTPGLNFINVLRTAFTLVDSESIKNTYNLTAFFTLLESTSIKVVRRILMELTPGVGGVVSGAINGDA
jgi:hypothetical protein